MTGKENWDFLYAYMYLRFWPSNVPMISDLNQCKCKYNNNLIALKIQMGLHQKYACNSINCIY